MVSRFTLEIVLGDVITTGPDGVIERLQRLPGGNWSIGSSDSRRVLVINTERQTISFMDDLEHLLYDAHALPNQAGPFRIFRARSSEVRRDIFISVFIREGAIRLDRMP